jgi:hypothetical protein
LKLSRLTVQHKAWTVGKLFDFLHVRCQGDIHRLTGYQVEQVIDEFDRPAQADYGAVRVPPSDDEVATLFEQWRASLPARAQVPAGGCTGSPPTWTTGTAPGPPRSTRTCSSTSAAGTRPAP